MEEGYGLQAQWQVKKVILGQIWEQQEMQELQALRILEPRIPDDEARAAKIGCFCVGQLQWAITHPITARNLSIADQNPGSRQESVCSSITVLTVFRSSWWFCEGEPTAMEEGARLEHIVQKTTVYNSVGRILRMQGKSKIISEWYSYRIQNRILLTGEKQHSREKTLGTEINNPHSTKYTKSWQKQNHSETGGKITSGSENLTLLRWHEATRQIPSWLDQRLKQVHPLTSS